MGVHAAAARGTRLQRLTGIPVLLSMGALQRACLIPYPPALSCMSLHLSFTHRAAHAAHPHLSSSGSSVTASRSIWRYVRRPPKSSG